jgi:AraC-like DNA-binding protein
MTFFAPGQSITVEDYTPSKIEGWALILHPDFLQGYPLANKIKNYGLFSYATNEALHVSEKEDNIISGIMQNLQQEIETMIDDFTQDVVVSHIELLLTYCNRFYHRQFITRKTANNTLVAQMETLLTDYLNSDQLIIQGLPTVQYIAQQLNISPSYLGDMLRYHTGMNTQQHIQTKLIEKAKDLLTSTNLTVAEIAYQIGFEHPQSFNKLFKNKTNQSPLEYRQSFN